MTNSEKSSQPMRILLINCDWRNIFQTQFHELMEKLERDRLAPTLNHFFIFSWSNVSYVEKKNEHFFTVHKKIIWKYFKPFFELCTRFAVPKALAQHAEEFGGAPDVILTYDFGFLPTARKIQRKTGGKIVMCINNMPRLYSAT